jgi:hypothetical protein
MNHEAEGFNVQGGTKMKKYTWRALALSLLITAPALAGISSLTTRIGQDAAVCQADMKRLLTTNAAAVVFEAQLDSLEALEVPAEQCCRYLLNRLQNPGEAPSFDRVLSAILDLKAAGVEAEQGLALGDLQAKKEEEAVKEGKEAQKKLELEKDFLGVNWSLGIALSVDLSGDERIDDAELVNGVVRVKEESSANVGFFWEVHKYWLNNKGRCLNKKKKNKTSPCDQPDQTHEFANWGLGPFVGITTTQDDLIDSFSIGAMFGRSTLGDRASLNFGLGLIYEPGVQVLGDGILADMPLPEGETAIRFKKEDRWGALVAVSFRF